MNKKAMLEQLINYYTDGNKAKFAAQVGIKPQLVSTWLSRGTFDAEVLYAGCKGVGGDWLLSGNGEMINDTQNDMKNVKQLSHSEREFYQQQIAFLNDRVRFFEQRNSELENELLNQLREKKVDVG